MCFFFSLSVATNTGPLTKWFKIDRVHFTRGDGHLPLQVDQPRNTSRSATSWTGLLRASRLAVAGRQYVSFSSLPAAFSIDLETRHTVNGRPRGRRARLTKPSPFPSAFSDDDLGSTIRACTHRAARPVQLCRTSHRLRTWQVVGEWLIVSRYSALSFMARRKCQVDPASLIDLATSLLIWNILSSPC
jgi:hypothetical protein